MGAPQIKALVEPAFVLYQIACELLWANAGGLALLDADSLEALRAVSLSERMLKTPAARMQAKCRGLRRDAEGR